MGLLQRFWSNHRLATIICLALLFIGLLLQPWSLIFVLAVAFGGPLLGRLESLASYPISTWRRKHWIVLSLVLSVLLLALASGSSGRGALILALMPVAWVLVTDQSILQIGKEDEKERVIEAAAEEPHTPLIDGELLAKVKELGDVSKSDLVRACGYFSIKEDGDERLNFTGFYEALLGAKDIGLDSSINSNEEDDHEDDENTSDNSKTDDLPDGWKELESYELLDRLKTSLDVSPEVLRSLSVSDDWSVRRSVAWHDNTPDDVLKKLSKDEDPDVINATGERALPQVWRFMDRGEKIEALKSDDVTSEIIEQLASSDSYLLRQAVAWSPSTPEEILEKLKIDDDDDVKLAATTERQLPMDWRFLSCYEKAERLGKESADLAILELLVKSPDSDVRRAVALHQATPEQLLSVLRKDDDESVQSGIRERDLPEPWKTRDEDDRITALKTDEAAENVLTILSQSDSWRIRQAVALSPGTSQDILDELSKDSDSDVQSAVRERTLPDEWQQLDADEKVKKLSKIEAPTEVLDVLAKSGQWLIRQAVAKNSGSSESLLREMIENDGDDDVIKAAKRRLNKITGDDNKTIALGPTTYYFGIYQGDSNSGSCYLAELQTTEQGDHDIDDDEITEELREELEEGSIGWGPFKDQNLVVWTEEDGEEEIIAVIDIEEAIDNERVHDCQLYLGHDTKGIHIIGVQTEKGGFNGEAELDIEEFEEELITFGLVNLADNWFIIHSVQYDGVDIEMEGDSTGKSSEYYKFEDDETEYIC